MDCTPDTDRIPRGMKVRKAEKPPYVVDRSRFRRFDRKNTVFQRVGWDTSWEGYRRKSREEMPSTIAQGRPGYSGIDFALVKASRAVQRALRRGSPHVGEDSRLNADVHQASSVRQAGRGKIRLKVDEEHGMSDRIRRAAGLFGASLVGICKVNMDWVYANADIPEELENAVVMAIEMDADAIAASPAPLAAAATGVGYSRMAFTLACMGEFIRNLGYEAMQCGNDTALSIPLAIDAGLGELGRNGLLITPQYGPRVRICKILTDLPLEPDRPIEFGVREVCKKCKLCAQHCEADAISMDDEPSFKVTCKSNNPGVQKWYVNVERCYLFWRENGVSCSTCIKVCPYNEK